MHTPYSCQLRRGPEGRIVEKIETVSGRRVTWTYDYDAQGRLTGAKLDGRTVCDIGYDREGRRARDYFPHLDSHYRNFAYSLMDNRLQRAGNNGYTHDKNGFRSIWNHGGQYTLYEYGPDYRLLKAEWPEKCELTFTHDDQGRRAAKYRDGRLVEAYAWHDLIRLAGFFDGQREYEFTYQGEERTPYAMRREDGAVFTLHYDQVGSLRVVADEDGNVIKEVQYDPFGSILADTNPVLRIPIGFAGGLHDRDLGFVRFGWRDYDTFTSRWTAPDPIGDKGGDPDWYGYCLDDPVNGNDRLGLMGSHPEEPEGPHETEPSFQDSWQWQASPGACEKCRALDGRMFFDDLSSAPEKPHPNCKCKLVRCFYHSAFSVWSVVKKSEAKYSYPNPVVFPLFSKVVPILWVKSYAITEKRKRTIVRECGDREEEIETIVEQRDRKVVDTKYANAFRDSDTVFWTNNPWVPGDTRGGTVYPTY